jgi:hypothetical protein
MSDAAMHMYSAAIDSLPDVHDPEFPHRAGIILAGLRKLQGSLSEAAGRSRVTPSVIVALSGVRHRYDELMEMAANGPGATVGQRLYIARGRAKLSTKEQPTAWVCVRTSLTPPRRRSPPPRTRPPGSRT